MFGHASGEHRIDYVGRFTAIAQHDFRARNEEVGHLALNGLSIEFDGRIGIEGSRDRAVERNGQARSEHVHDADRRTAQRERIRRSGRPLAYRE